jgi:hypothetical protein
MAVNRKSRVYSEIRKGHRTNRLLVVIMSTLGQQLVIVVCVQTIELTRINAFITPERAFFKFWRIGWYYYRHRYNRYVL